MFPLRAPVLALSLPLLCVFFSGLSGCSRSAPVASLQSSAAGAYAATGSNVPDALLPGESATLIAYDGQGNPATSARWSSADPTVASVSDAGVVTANAVGQTTVTAVAGSKTTPMTISVVNARVEALFDQALTANRSMSGLLLGTGATQPQDAQIQPLQPRNWLLADLSLYPRARGFGADVEYELSDVWGYPASNWPRGRPYDASSNYAGFVRQQALQGLTHSISWNVWNEPDDFFSTGSWDGTRQQFFETYLAAYQAIRSVLGSTAVIVGPSISRYDADFLAAFADYCLAQGCEINLLSWHELGYHRPLSTIADHLAAVRRDIVDNPKYAALKIKDIQINETVGPLETLNPAAILTYLRYLELGGASGAARACWTGADGNSTCKNQTLDGLLTPDSLQPRAAWWAYKLYADGTASRVAGTTTDARYLVLASSGSASTATAQVLTGYSSVNVDAAPANAWVAVRLKGLGALPFQTGANLQVTVRGVPASGEAALAAPQDFATLTVPVNAGAATVILKNLAQDSAYSLSVR